MTCHVIPQCVTNANYSETEKTCHSAASSEAEKREIDNCTARPRPSWLCWGGILSGSAQVVLRNPGQPPASPAQPSPAQPSPGRTFPTFLGRNVVWRVPGPGQPGTGHHHHHHTSPCLTHTHTVSSQGDGTCSHPPQRIKQFSFVRRFLGPVDMLIITLDTNFSLGWIQCSALL